MLIYLLALLFLVSAVVVSFEVRDS